MNDTYYVTMASLDHYEGLPDEAPEDTLDQPPRVEKLELVFMADPGHGWIVLTKYDQEALGLDESSFTEFSYTHNGVIYAEEDCDAAVVIARHIARFGCEPAFRHHEVANAPCRGYARCHGRPDYATASAVISEYRAANP